MADTFSKQKRSEIMRQVKSKNTKPEILLKKILRSMGLKYKFHYAIEGTPDAVLLPYKIALFVDGCFWHRCPKCFRMPKSNVKYWNSKINENVLRARKVNAALKKKSWRVLRIREHDLMQNPEKVKKQIKRSMLN